MKKLKIGITIGLKSTDESIWTNGMKQNVLFLYKLLSHSVKNYDVWILNTTNLDLTEKPQAFRDVQIASMKEDFYNIGPYTLSEGGRRPFHWNRLQGKKQGNRYKMPYSVYKPCKIVPCVKSRNE